MEEPEKKRTRIELSREVDNREESVEKRCEENEDSAVSIVCLPYDILRIVFRYLSGEDLSSVSMVCRSWLEAADKERNLRGPYCFVQQYTSSDICAMCEKKSSSNKPIRCLNVIHKNLVRTKSLIWLKKLPIKPSVGFFFLCLETPRDLTKNIYELLPKSCGAVILFTDGIILNNSEMEHSLPSMVCAFLPQIANVKISMVAVTDSEKRKNKYEKYVQMLKKVPKQDHESTCLMLFCSSYGCKMGSRMADMAKLIYAKSRASFWGGVVEDIHTKTGNFMQDIIKPYCLAILITGPIKTWSTIMDKRCNTKEQVEEKLKVFKEQVKLQKHSVGFMFACKARGKTMYREKNVESTIFKRLFPEVPLAGCFGFGEFGRDTTVCEPDSESELDQSLPDEKEKKRNVWYQEFSTMFMILTYG